MPSRNRAREAAKAASQAPDGSKTADKKASVKKSGKKSAKGRKTNRQATTTRSPGSDSGAASKPTRRTRTGPMLDPSASDDAETRFVQPYEATKVYLCPGCNRDIAPGVGHLVAVPPDQPDLRRHWHRGCWNNRHTRF